MFEDNVRSDAYKQLRDIPMRFQSLPDTSQNPRSVSFLKGMPLQN
jgi:hypothetical protein